MPFLAVLAFAVALLQASAAPPKDALALLNEVSQRYADAKSYHIEAVEERMSEAELSRHWDKTLSTAIATPAGRYRYEGRTSLADALMVSDGTTQWMYHPEDHLYTQQPASANDADAGRVIGMEEMPAHNAKFLIQAMAHRADRLKSATFLADETIVVNGQSIECYVVHYVDEPSQRGSPGLEWTVWIDKAQKVMVRTFSRGTVYTYSSAGGLVPSHAETTVTYNVIELDQTESASSFRFVAPADAKLVSEFPHFFAQKPSAAERTELTGKPAPDVQLKSSDGTVLSLSGLRGKPVFVEFWATWCMPCVELMPGLAKLHAETANKGLVWEGIDSDKDSELADKFLEREHMSWPNYHDPDGSYGKAFHRAGIPLGVLVNAQGTITFYKSGYSIGDLRAAIAKLGPEFSSVASPNPGTEPTAK